MAKNCDAIDFSDVWVSALDGGSVGLWDRDIVANDIRYSRSWDMIVGVDHRGSRCRIEESYSRVHPEDLESVKAAIQDHFDQKTAFYEAEHRIRSQNGCYKWVLSRGKVIKRDDGGKPLRMVGTTIDVTASHELSDKLKMQQRRAEADAERLAVLAQELGERSNELAAAQRIARIGNWRWDLPGRCIWFSPEVWNLMGRKPQDSPVSYLQMRSMIHPDDYEKAMAEFYRAVREREQISQEYRIIYPDGSIHNMLTYAEAVVGPDNRVKRLHGTSQDISPYRTIEAALAESEDHYRHMVNLHPQIPWLADPLGNVTEVGPLWSKLTGMTSDETLPEGWTHAVHEEDLPLVHEAWLQSVSTGEALDIEYRLRLQDGRYGWFRARAAARRDGNGRIIRWYGTLEDVTDRRLAEDSRRASERLALRVLRTTGDGVIVCDKDGIIKFINNIAEKLLGMSLNCVGSRADDFFIAGHSYRIGQAIAAVSRGNSNEQFEVFWPPFDAWYEINIYSGDEDISIFIRDISEIIINRKRLAYAANHDLLTGIFNRNYFFERVRECLLEQGPGNRAALLCIDLDYFKEINDLYGHPVGDQILKQLALRLRSCIRGTDLLARCGGDEFVILQMGVSTPNDSIHLAERISVVMKAPFDVDGISLSSTLSIGISVANVGFSDVDILYKQADLALYEAKTKSRGSFQVFRPEMQLKSDRTKRMRTDLLAAIGTNQFFLVYQPIMKASDQSIVGVEALLRWHHPDRGIISPTEFIPVAEETGLIIPIGTWALRQACQTARNWPSNIKVSVNASIKQLENNDLAGVVRDALRDTGIPAERLKLEVTESVLMTENSISIDTLKEIQSTGVSIILDDFGTGYSSLSYMNSFSFDFIKIDKSFISNICLPGDREPIFEAIMGMAKAIKIPVTVEGVETVHQLEYIRGLGCEFVQGYLLAKPMSETAISRVLQYNGGISNYRADYSASNNIL